MDKVYQHQSVEQKWYEIWEKNGYFIPKKELKKKPFTIILPPPNANADLHMGHAMYTIEDIMIRYHRMKGEPTLWLPGADHAGFETQYVFEKHLAKMDKSRFDYTREELYKMIWDFVQKNRITMENQLRRLGFSLDWSKNVFTLDPKIIEIVYKTFKKLYEGGTVYRSERLVNYCVNNGTSFSDLEVKDQEVIGKLYFINFPLEKGGFIPIATTRPETMLGDVAVMVNPKDKRYQHLKGETVVLPISNRKVPIIADEFVDMKFGTGAVKLTPNHDFNDFEIAKKHRLYYPPIIGFNGKIQNSKTDYDGLKVLQARTRMIEEDPRMKSLIKKIKDHKMVVKTCYKCGKTLEPLPLPQWYVKVTSLKDKAIAAIKNKKIRFTPKRFEKVALQWLTNFHDWNISRQLVWGIRIPAWKCLTCSKDGQERWVVTDGKTPTHCPNCQGNRLIQDSDTFDTWFSSGQWPFATLLTTGESEFTLDEGIIHDADFESDYHYFYPTSVMETGYDILPWWVCRMIMLGINMTEETPFAMVYLHGLVRDAKGQKMSKSRGNVINPLVMADKYGADALRMALVFGTSAGNDLSISEDKIRGMRNFTNKLWNMARFLKMDNEKKNLTNKSAEDKNLEKVTGNTVKEVTKYIESYLFGQAAERLYEVIWHELADIYIENYKKRLVSYQVLFDSFKTLLTLIHPFMPFITEEINKQLQPNSKPLIISSFPTV